MYKRVKDHEKSIKNIIKTININQKNAQEKHEEIQKNTDAINSTLNDEIKKLNSFIEKVDNKIMVYDEDLDNLKDKLKDFNIYDMFKYQNLSSEIDEDFIKKLVTNLESKINRKFNFIDDKIKMINKELFKMKEDEKNEKAIISGYNLSFEKLIKLKEELNQKYSNLSNSLDENIKDIKIKLEFLDSKLNNLDNIYNFNEEKYNEFINNKQKLNELPSENLNNKAYAKMNINYFSEASNDIKKLKESLNNLENYCKNNFNEINNIEIERRLLLLEKNKNYLLYEEELNSINEKNRFQDLNIKEHNGKIDSILQELVQMKDDIKELFKKLNSINFDMTKHTHNEVSKIIESKTSNIDSNNFISSSIFNENKKDNITKFEKMQKKFEELDFSIDRILEKLAHTPSDTDFSQFQDIMKNMLENIIIKNKKQFANKLETAKSYKLLETKLNTINDSYNKKLSGADNWLLAKKPLNSYQCASCESILKGDLDQKREFIPWNKYPFREENKSYRMGHGFSHMLHMINEGLMKDTGEYLKDDENKKGIKEENNNNLFFDKNKRNNCEDLSLEMLPKVRKKTNIYNLSIGFESPINKSREIKQINKTIDNQENTPIILKILKKNRSTVFKSATNNIKTERPKNIENIKYINFNGNNKEKD